MRWTIDITHDGQQALSWQSHATSREEAVLRAEHAAASIAATAGIDCSSLKVARAKAGQSEPGSGMDWITLGPFGELLLDAAPPRAIREDAAREAILSLLCMDPRVRGDEENPSAMILATASKGLNIGAGALCKSGDGHRGKSLPLSPAVIDAMAAITFAHAIGLNLRNEHRLLTIGPSEPGSATQRAILLQRYRSRSREGVPETVAVLRRIGATPIAEGIEALMVGGG